MLVKDLHLAAIVVQGEDGENIITGYSDPDLIRSSQKIGQATDTETSWSYTKGLIYQDTKVSQDAIHINLDFPIMVGPVGFA